MEKCYHHSQTWRSHFCWELPSHPPPPPLLPSSFKNLERYVSDIAFLNQKGWHICKDNLDRIVISGILYRRSYYISGPVFLKVKAFLASFWGPLYFNKLVLFILGHHTTFVMTRISLARFNLIRLFFKNNLVINLSWRLGVAHFLSFFTLLIRLAVALRYFPHISSFSLFDQDIRFELFNESHSILQQQHYKNLVIGWCGSFEHLSSHLFHFSSQIGFT